VIVVVYEFILFKDVCFGKCCSLFGFLLSIWCNGIRGVFEMGVWYGVWCVGCCWVLMVLLFVFGVMSLVWMVFVVVLIVLEKIVLFV